VGAFLALRQTFAVLGPRPVGACIERQVTLVHSELVTRAPLTKRFYVGPMGKPCQCQSVSDPPFHESMLVISVHVDGTIQSINQQYASIQWLMHVVPAAVTDPKGWLLSVFSRKGGRVRRDRPLTKASKSESNTLIYAPVYEERKFSTFQVCAAYCIRYTKARFQRLVSLVASQCSAWSCLQLYFFFIGSNNRLRV
jgi:hypothetical protein